MNRIISHISWIFASQARDGKEQRTRLTRGLASHLAGRKIKKADYETLVDELKQTYLITPMVNPEGGATETIYVELLNT